MALILYISVYSVQQILLGIWITFHDVENLIKIKKVNWDVTNFIKCSNNAVFTQVNENKLDPDTVLLGIVVWFMKLILSR